MIGPYSRMSYSRRYNASLFEILTSVFYTAKAKTGLAYTFMSSAVMYIKSIMSSMSRPLLSSLSSFYTEKIKINAPRTLLYYTTMFTNKFKLKLIAGYWEYVYTYFYTKTSNISVARKQAQITSTIKSYSGSIYLRGSRTISRVSRLFSQGVYINAWRSFTAERITKFFSEGMHLSLSSLTRAILPVVFYTQEVSLNLRRAVVESVRFYAGKSKFILRRLVKIVSRVYTGTMLGIFSVIEWLLWNSPIKPVVDKYCEKRGKVKR